MSDFLTASLRERALAAERAGRAEEARRLFDQALGIAPSDAAIINSAAGAALRQGDAPRAERLYARALSIDPTSLELAINLAIALGHLQRNREAAALLTSYERAGEQIARYWSARAAAERATGALAEAARSYDRCLAFEPTHPRGLHGRARVALERGEPTMDARFDAAVAVLPGDSEVWLGRAHALDACGNGAGALRIVESLVRQAPGWIDALHLLAKLRHAAGEIDHFADGYAAAAERDPSNIAIPLAWAQVLAGIDRHADAAEVVASARARFADDSELALAEAVYAGAAGNDDRAEAIFTPLKLHSAKRNLQEARHRLRRGEPERAEALLGCALETDPDNISCWALRAIAWRLLNDPRSDWLNDQGGLVNVFDLALDESALMKIIGVLDKLHDGSVEPIGQSLRSGTQTRGALVTRWEPELLALAQSLDDAIERYRRALPPADSTHPLLRHRDVAWRIVGSWSVRLMTAGRHVPHIHPEGIVSSAAYFALPPPDPTDTLAGMLELGRPPTDLRLDLPPLRRIEPRVGRLALFPSTLYHGTAPFARGRRMTVAFDVGPVR